MRLLYFTFQINELGGLQRIVIDKVNWFARNGYRVTLCNVDNREVNPYFPVDSSVKLVRGNLTTTPGGIFTRLKGLISSVNQLRQIIAEEKPDLIINAFVPQITWILPFIFHHTPKVVEIHKNRYGIEEFDKVYFNFIERVMHIHALRWIYRKYDKFVVLTTGDAMSWNLKNCITIPNSTNMPLKGKNEKKPDYAKRSIVVVARLSQEKRIDLMIKIWERIHHLYSDWEVNVYGEGSERKPLQNMIDKSGLNNSFHLCGSTLDVKEKLDNSDILALTSEYEGFGLVLIEAMMRRLPVVTFEFVGVQDIVTDGENGFIVPWNDLDTFANKLRNLMDNAKLREQMGDNAICTVSKFSKETVMNHWKILFDSLIDDKDRFYI